MIVYFFKIVVYEALKSFAILKKVMQNEDMDFGVIREVSKEYAKNPEL